MTYFSDEDSKKKHRKKFSYKEARIKAASFCAYQERYQQEVRDKLYSYGLSPQEVEELLSYLISEGFINEERFAKVFSGGKFRMKKWGKVKIKNELIKRKISSYCIDSGLKEIDNDDYLETIHNLIEKKFSTLKQDNNLIIKKRIANYLIRKGFERELVWNILNDKFSD